MKKIIFQTNQLSIRGTEVAIFDYANFNEEILNNESIILTKRKHTWPHHPDIQKKFENRFKVIYYNDFSEVEKILEKEKIDIFYSMKGGNYDGILSKNIPNAIHVVFQENSPHGEVYAYISEWLSKKMTNGNSPFVDYIVNYPKIEGDFRDKLNIPKDALVYGRYGGLETFDIGFVHQAIFETALKNPNIYFLFAYTNRFCRALPNIIHIPYVSNIEDKMRFVNTCDAMIHARFGGESFGLAIAEFSVNNKPIITFSGKDIKKYYPHNHDEAHLEILGDTCVKYDNYQDIKYVLNNFTPDKNKNYDVYSEKYSPKNVMKKFDEVFINPLI